MIQMSSINKLNFASVKKNYDRDGFVILRNLLDVQALSELRDRALSAADELLDNNNDDSAYKNIIKSLDKRDPWFNHQLAQGSHVSLMKYLLNGEIEGVSAAWFDRPDGSPHGISPHVDVIGSYREPDAGATIWFALDQAQIENGCLYYLRGSHKNKYPINTFISGIDTQSKDAVAAELKPGDAVIHSALTIHWSCGNESGHPRRAISYFYWKTGIQDKM